MRAAIVTGQLRPGSRLLATRALANELGVARNTVLYAYEQLATEGLIRGTPRGSVVITISLSEIAAPKGPARSNAVARRMQGLRTLPASGAEAGAFAPGVPALDLFPLAPWRRIVERTWRDIDPAQLNYADVAGVPVLREEIRSYLMASRGVRCEVEQIFVTSGTQASLEICARTFADAGAISWIENPGYIGALAAFRAAQLRTIGIAVDGEGIRPSSQDWKLHPPKLIYTTPSHQYPTGGVLCMARRLALLEQAGRTGALIIEDDYDSEFRYDGPPLAAMQGLIDDAPVIYVGTFSKTMFPAIRTAYMVVPKNLVGPLRSVLSRMSTHGRTADQIALAAFLRGGQFGVHLRRMRRVYRSRRDVLIAALRQHLGQFGEIHGESAGMHMALQFAPGGAPDTDIARAALEQGVVVRALSAHSTGLREHGWNGLMFGFSQVAEADIEAMVERVASVMVASA
ncbi:MAG: PLP-dependent aminotransferase family protein [Pseudomonadota bacterium]